MKILMFKIPSDSYQQTELSWNVLKYKYSKRVSKVMQARIAIILSDLEIMGSQN